MNFIINKFNTNEKILSILVQKNVYTGGTSGQLTNRTTNKILHTHGKSITSIASFGEYLSSTSYDCTTAILKNEILFDVIEGPETEIKEVSFNKSFIALATRGKSVWVCRFGEYIEIERILEDHTEDVKGCKFYGDSLFTFGYDTSLKIYNYLELTESFELVQEITIGETVWDLVVEENNLFIASDSGEVIKYHYKGEWEEEKRVKLGIRPIYSICKYKDCIVVGVNGGNLVFLNLLLEIIYILEDLHSDNINCICYSPEDNLLATCSDDCSYSLLYEGVVDGRVG